MNILIADDHGLFRAGLAGVLTQLAGADAPKHASTVDEAVAQLEAHDFDLILLDLFMPGMDGVEGLTTLRRRAPTSPIVVVSASVSARHADAALAAGASGFIAKSVSPTGLLTALTAIIDDGDVCVLGVEYAPDVDPIASLTPRQKDIARCVALGLSNREIAARRSISEGTVKLHVSNILRALGLKNRSALARLISVAETGDTPEGV